MTALDTGGFAALVELLTVYHLDEQSGYWRLEVHAIEVPYMIRSHARIKS